MLLIPFDQAFDWRRPPLVTLLLIVVNVLCFFVWQSNEDDAMRRAMSYYASSGLVELEYAPFQSYLRSAGRADELPSLQEIKLNPERMYYSMLQETPFWQRLESGRIIRPQHDDYQAWKELRGEFSALVAKVTFLEYGWKSGAPDWQSLFSHMFLHANFMHLLGNMLFLLAVGFLVEGVLSSWVFLLCYLLVGMGSAGLDYLIRVDSLIPGIGASGAISGVMGMYAVLFWNRTVRVFYFLFAYFDYIRLPAIALLPLWIGNELYQMAAHPESNINFVAHLGGFLSGALMGGLAKYSPAFDLSHVEEQERSDSFSTRLQQARAFCDQQDFKAALPLLRSLYREQPNNQQVLYHSFMAERLYPESEQFHMLSSQILSQPMSDPSISAMVYEVFNSYVKLARPKPRIKRELACRLLSGFHNTGKQDAAIRLQKMLNDNGVKCPEHDDAVDARLG